MTFAGNHFRLSHVGLVTALQVVSKACIPNGVMHRRVPECLEDLCVDGHGRNRDAGWWTNPKTGEPLDRNVPEMLMLTISELAEIPPFPLHMSEHDDKLPHRLMAEVEMADALIRMFDILGSRLGEGSDLLYCTEHLFTVSHTMFAKMESHRLDVQLMGVVRIVSAAMEAFRKQRTMMLPRGYTVPLMTLALVDAVLALFFLGNAYGFDLPAAIIEKMEFNATREDHKREVRIAPGGKAF